MALEKVVQECLRGNDAAWRTLVDTFSRRIFNMAYQFCGRYEEAEDMTQEIFMKLYTSLPKYNPEKNFTAWVLTLAKNHLIDAYRHSRREKSMRDEFDEHLLGALTPDPEQIMLATEEHRLVWQGLDKLPADMRLAIILTEIQGKSYEEAASILGVPVGTVKSRVSRGKIQLAHLLRPSGGKP